MPDEIAYGDPDRAPASRPRLFVAVLAVAAVAIALPASRVVRADRSRAAENDPNTAATQPRPLATAELVAIAERSPIVSAPPGKLPTDLDAGPYDGQRAALLLIADEDGPKLLRADTGDLTPIRLDRPLAPRDLRLSGWHGLRSGDDVFVHRQPTTIGDEPPPIGELYVLRGTLLRFLAVASDIAPGGRPGISVVVTRDETRGRASTAEVDGSGVVTRRRRPIPIQFHVIRGMPDGSLLTRVDDVQPTVMLWDPVGGQARATLPGNVGSTATANVVAGMDCEPHQCQVTVTDIRTRRSRVLPRLPRGRLHLTTTISPDGRWLATVATELQYSEAESHVVTAIDLRTGRSVDIPGTHVDAETSLRLEWSPDSQRLYVATMTLVGVWSPGESDIAVFQGAAPRGVFDLVCVSGC